jgi:hypothetical protein
LKLRLIGFIVIACGLLAVAPGALAAGGAAGAGYSGEGGLQNEVNQAAVNAAAAQGSLPFTGRDLALLVIGGFTLLIVGAGLRRLAGRNI